MKGWILSFFSLAILFIFMFSLNPNLWQEVKNDLDDYKLGEIIEDLPIKEKLDFFLKEDDGPKERQVSVEDKVNKEDEPNEENNNEVLIEPKSNTNLNIKPKPEKSSNQQIETNIEVNSGQASLFKDEVISLINDERSKNGLNNLKQNTVVSSLARLKSEDMRDNNYFETISPTYGSFTDMLKNNGVQYRVASEKIAAGSNSPQKVFEFWIQDSNFRESILRSNFTHVGVGYAGGEGNYHHYWTLWLLEKPSPISASLRSDYEKEVLELTNIERTNLGLNPLKWDNELDQVARAKSEDMRDKNYFAHESPTYGSLGDILKAFNISYTGAAENLAAGQKTPEEAVTGWMNSPGHRENILKPDLTHLGVGYADGGGDYYVYWTQIFTTKP